MTIPHAHLHFLLAGLQSFGETERLITEDNSCVRNDCKKNTFPFFIPNEFHAVEQQFAFVEVVTVNLQLT